jgi:hypothetical protein
LRIFWQARLFQGLPPPKPILQRKSRSATSGRCGFDCAALFLVTGITRPCARKGVSMKPTKLRNPSEVLFGSLNADGTCRPNL